MDNLERQLFCSRVLSIRASQNCGHCWSGLAAPQEGVCQSKDAVVAGTETDCISERAFSNSQFPPVDEQVVPDRTHKVPNTPGHSLLPRDNTSAAPLTHIWT